MVAAIVGLVVVVEVPVIEVTAAVAPESLSRPVLLALRPVLLLSRLVLPLSRWAVIT